MICDNISKKLKSLLDETGEYSICRTDNKNMEWSDVISVGNVLEKLSELTQ